MILRPLFSFEDTKNTGLLIFNSLKTKEILADNRKSHHPIETLLMIQFSFHLTAITIILFLYN